jgi:NADP-dependent aldehyde dehydrogenase
MIEHELSGRHLINGEWRRSPQDGAFGAINPATGASLMPVFLEATKAEVDAAMNAAREAFEATHELPPNWQAGLLNAVADAIMDLGEPLLVRAQEESGLPQARLTGERARTVGQIKMFAQVVREGSWVDAVIDTADPNRKPAAKPDLRRMLRPRGPVVVFGASNFPLAFGTLGGDTASALAGGNPVVVKGHPSHPGTSELVAAAVLYALRESNLPLGLFALLQGKSHGLSQMLVEHPFTEAVGFTGSQKAGRALFDLAAKRARPIPVYAEMGSLNPIVILPAAAKERGDAIAEGLAGSVLLGGGQFCTKPGVILTIGDDRKFIDNLAQHIQKTAAVTMLNSGLRDNFASRCSSFSGVPGVKTVLAPKAGNAAMMSPGLFETSAQTWQKDHRLHEEAFGPGALVIHCKDVDEAIACLKSVEGSLTGTVQIGSGEDQQTVQRVVRAMEPNVGRVIINGYPTGVEVNHAIVHGGPYPATTDPGTTSVGSAAIRRFVRMVAYQDTPQQLLPPALRNDNPLHIERTVNGKRTSAAI